MSTDAGILWFVGMGFRPAVTTPPHRADEVDYPRIVPAPDSDVPFMSKYDALEPFLPSEGYAWGTWIPAPVTDTPQITAASLAVSTPGLPWHPAAPITPGWPILPPDVDYPCMCITPPDVPVEPAPVPVPASAGLLLVAVAALALWRRK